MDKLKKTEIGEIKKIKIDQESLNCPPESLNKCCKPGPFFNPDYFGHVVVQTLEELNSIPCKLRQDGMVATIVQDNYSEWQIQSSRTGFGICDNQVWVKVSAGDLVYDGGNLFIFETEQDADSYISNSHTTKQGQMLYITELDNYYKFDGQDGYTDPFPNKLEVPTTQGTDETLEYKIPTYVNGKPYWRNATDFGKVDSVNDKTPDANKNVNIDIDDVLSKGMPTSETTDENKKVLLYDDTGKSYWKSLSEVGKVKTVNNQDPDESGNIALPEQQFVKNGEGWSLKYSLDNPTFYGALGSKALDLSVSLRASVDVNFPHGAVGPYTQVFGYNNSALGGGSFVSGMSNKCQGQTNHIVSYRSVISEEKGSANKGKYANGIFGGEANAIKNSIYSTILGGAWHEIIGDANPRTSASYNQSNAIIGGYKNKIISATGTNMQAYGSVIFGGEENIAQGHYNMIAGYKNHAVTIGETLVGLYGTIQNTSLSGYDFISNSRMFNVGIGDSTTQNAVTRKDGLSVFRNGLVTVPSITNTLIENNAKATTTKEFVDNKVSNFPLPTHWTNAQQRMSALVSKHNDTTYNRLLGMDANGNLNEVGLLAMTNEMSKATDDQKDAWRVASRKTGETYSTGQARIDFTYPPALMPSVNTITLIGANLFLDVNTSNASIDILDSRDGTVVETISNINVHQLVPSRLSFQITPSKYEKNVYYNIRVLHNNVYSLLTNKSRFILLDTTDQQYFSTDWIIGTDRSRVNPTFSVVTTGNETIFKDFKTDSAQPNESSPINFISDKKFDMNKSYYLEIWSTYTLSGTSPTKAIRFGFTPEQLIPTDLNMQFELTSQGVFTAGHDVNRWGWIPESGDGRGSNGVAMELVVFISGGIVNIFYKDQYYTITLPLTTTGFYRMFTMIKDVNTISKTHKMVINNYIEN